MGRTAFKAVELLLKWLAGSTPASSANPLFCEPAQRSLPLAEHRDFGAGLSPSAGFITEVFWPCFWGSSGGSRFIGVMLYTGHCSILSAMFKHAETSGWPERRRPLVIGHRGARGHVQENTLASFAKASELGADMWELDVHLTTDGVCVVSHDGDLSRIAGIPRKISEMTSSDVANVETVAIPTFSQVVDLAEELGTGLYVELKGEGTGPIVWRELASRQFRFAAIGSFRADMVRELRDHECGYPLAVLIRAGGDPFALAERSGADIIHLCWENASPRPQDLVTPALLQKARSAGLEVVLWHEERPEIIADIVAMPVLGICSDCPELISEARGVR